MPLINKGLYAIRILKGIERINRTTSGHLIMLPEAPYYRTFSRMVLTDKASCDSFSFNPNDPIFGAGIIRYIPTYYLASLLTCSVNGTSVNISARELTGDSSFLCPTSPSHIKTLPGLKIDQRIDDIHSLRTTLSLGYNTLYPATDGIENDLCQLEIQSGCGMQKPLLVEVIPPTLPIIGLIRARNSTLKFLEIYANLFATSVIPINNRGNWSENLPEGVSLDQRHY